MRRWQSFRASFALPCALVACVAVAGSVGLARAQPAADAHAGHAMPMPSASTTPTDTTTENASSTAAPAMSMDVAAMQRGAPPPDARDPNAYSEGITFGATRPKMEDSSNFAALRIDNLEAARVEGYTLVPYDLEAWYGRTFDRGVLKSEGDIEGGKVTEARTELLWSHALAAFWDRQLGLRYDSGEGPDRRWVAFGVEGLSPYKFELEATAYLGESGRTALRFDGSRELLITQKLILQPRLEANVYGKADPERGLGSGLADVAASIRLRYELRREIAPYVGVEWKRKYGDTADLARANGQDANDAEVVVGVRLWF